MAEGGVGDVRRIRGHRKRRRGRRGAADGSCEDSDRPLLERMVHTHKLTESCSSIRLNPVIVTAVKKKTGRISRVLNLLFDPLERLEFETSPGVGSDIATPLSNGIGATGDVRGQRIAKAVMCESPYKTLRRNTAQCQKVVSEGGNG